ncbi:hypothetical protein AZE42_08608 [Rhizopogon vesiculosus]|uniref:Uncharacterized protein n=1 Tax=Rhizopogon vesiculosus TaxID=180088 RepID=A0A1J8PK41_9AGAM|nr:hypothetical protein AZE42_08608 [Rhizopogon vesiculosus]
MSGYKSLCHTHLLCNHWPLDLTSKGTRSSLHIENGSAVHKRRLLEGHNPVLALPSADSDVRKLQPPAEELVAGKQAVLLTQPVAVREESLRTCRLG